MMQNKIIRQIDYRQYYCLIIYYTPMGNRQYERGVDCLIAVLSNCLLAMINSRVFLMHLQMEVNVI
jgi:hypothetical protein